MGLVDWAACWIEDRFRSGEEWLLKADEAEQRRDRAARGSKRAQDEAEEHFDAEKEARDRIYAAEFKLGHVEERKAVIADQLLQAERNGSIDVGNREMDWNAEFDRLANVEHGLEMLTDRFEHDREEAEHDAREHGRKFATLTARANELAERALKHAEEYQRCVEGAGL